MKRILFLSFSLFLTFQLTAQKPLYLFPGWKIKHIGAMTGLDRDMIHNLDHNFLLQTARGDVSAFEGLSFDKQDMTSMVCENPHVRMEVALLPPGSRNTEVRLALAGLFNRTDAVDYSKGSYDQGSYESLHISSNASEIALETSYLKHLNINGPVRLYGGLGTNIGYAYSGSIGIHYRNNGQPEVVEAIASDNPLVYIDAERENIDRYYELRNGIHQRIFGHAGLGLRFFKRVELAYEYRWGVGYRATFSAPIKMTELRSGALALRWLLK